MAAKKTSTKASSSASGKSAARAAKASGAKKQAPRSMPKAGRDPKGGLTAAGREYFNKKEGLHLRPGVQGPADTPEKMVRKGSFLRRHFAHPRGPMKNEKGEPTRLALSAHAWGEPVPQSMGDARKLAAEGHELLEQYHAAKARGASVKGPAKSSTGSRPAKKSTAKAAPQKDAKPPVATKTAKNKTARKAAAKKGGGATRPVSGRSTAGKRAVTARKR